MIYLTSIISKVRDLSPGTKFFLMRFLQLYGEAFVSKKIKELSAELGLSDKLVSLAITELVKNGLLRKESVRVQGMQQRPTYKYKVVINRLIQVEKSKLETRVQQRMDAVRWLLDKKIIKRTKKEGEVKNQEQVVTRSIDPLSVPNRILMLVLLVHANDFGEVKGFSHAELRALTGLNKNRLNLQLNKLKQLGYLRSVVPGANGATLLGKVKGIYFLNIRHADLYSGFPKGMTIAFTGNMKHGLSAQTESRQMFTLAKRSVLATESFYEAMFAIHIRSLAFGSSIIVERSSSIYQYFLESHLEECFQAKLDEYASYLLSNHWSELPSEEMPYKSEPFMNVLLGKIEKELLGPTLLKMKKFPYKDSSLLVLGLCEFMYELVLFVAGNMKLLLIKTSRLLNISFEKLNCRIITGVGSNEPDAKYLIEVNFPEADKNWTNFYVLIPDNLSMPVREYWKDIELQRRYEYGLIERPYAFSDGISVI